MGVAGFVLSIIGLVFCWTVFIGWPTVVLGVIFSFVGLFIDKGRGLAIAGLVVGLVAVLLNAAFTSAWFGGDSLKPLFDRADSEIKREAAAAGTAGTPRDCLVTMARFEKLRTGMTYSEAVVTFGCPGTRSSNENSKVVYAWKTGTGTGSVRAVFENHKLVNAVQWGLQ